MSVKKREKRGRAKKPRTVAKNQKTIIIRGDVVDMIEAYQDKFPAKPAFIRCLEHFLRIGIDEHEKSNGPIVGSLPWKDSRDNNTIDHRMKNAEIMEDGAQKDERKKDIEDLFKSGHAW